MILCSIYWVNWRTILFGISALQMKLFQTKIYLELTYRSCFLKNDQYMDGLWISSWVSLSSLNGRIVFLPFNSRQLDTKCEYRVTKYGDAWNEFIKRGLIYSFKTRDFQLQFLTLFWLGLNFIEYGLFKGSVDNGATRYWPSSEKKRTKRDT